MISIPKKKNKLGRSGLYRKHYSMTERLVSLHISSTYIYIYKSNNIRLRLIVHERFIQLKGNLLQRYKMILPKLRISVAFTKNIYTHEKKKKFLL